MELRKGYTGDIDLGDILAKAITALVIALILVGVVNVGMTVVTRDTYKSNLAFNEYAETYNALDESTREKIIPLLANKPEEGETTLELIENPTDKLSKAEKIGLVIAYLACIAVASLAGFFSYANGRSYRYYNADLPYGKPIGKFLFIFFFAAWPIILCSAIHMLIVYLRERHKEKAALTTQIEEAIDQNQVIATINQSIKPSARKAFVNYCVRFRTKSFNARKKEAEDCAQEAENGVKIATSELKTAKRQLSIANARLRTFNEISPSASTSREDALRDFEEIRAMRGVRNISAFNGKHAKIVVDVRVQYPYKGTLYDFGDYRITIENGGFTCIRTRSGLKINHTSTTPDYYETRGFCFGSRRDTISQYVRGYRIAEALTLMIDSLHSVNSDEAESKIPECFRKVTTIQATEKRLRRRRKGGEKA